MNYHNYGGSTVLHCASSPRIIRLEDSELPGLLMWSFKKKKNLFVGLHVVASLNYLLSELIGVKEAKILCIIL